MIPITSKNLHIYISGATPILLYFSLPRCVACAQIEPGISEVETAWTGKIIIGNVVISQQGEIATRYGITVAPTLVLIRDRAVRGTKMGALPARDITNFLEDTL